MRYALRNKQKLIESFDINYYNLLIKSLDEYFKNNDTIEELTYETVEYKMIHVPNVQKNTDSVFEFAIIRKTYDCYLLAYYSCMG